MDYLLKVTTEVNDVKVVFYGKIFLEYSEEENHNCLQFQSEVCVSKLTGILRSKLIEAGNYLWDYEEYDEIKHANIDATDLTEIYNPIFQHSS